jgi:hypothetical protein
LESKSDTAGKILPVQEQFEYSTSFFECDLGFSLMHLILTSMKALLLTKTILELLFVWVVGPPPHHFSPTKYVESWMMKT